VPSSSEHLSELRDGGTGSRLVYSDRRSIDLVRIRDRRDQR
jgi:hypothetical protein